MSIISISCKASATPTSGHDFWFHLFQTEGFDEVWGNAILVGAKSQDGSRIRGLLHYGWRERPVSSFWLLRFAWADAKSIRKNIILPSQGDEHVIHIYEGGFRELALASTLMLIGVRAKIIFNANLTDPWHLALKNTTNPFSRIGLAGAREILRAANGRLVLLAETQNLSDLFRAKGMPPKDVYPLFASVDAKRSIASRRETDLVMFPNGLSEVNLCLEVAKQVAEKSPNLDLKMFMVPRWGYKLEASEKVECSKLGISLIEDTLTSEEYESLYLNSKVCIFPYIDDYYRVSSSGRVLDALALGARAYAPDESSASKTIRELNGGGGFNPLNLGDLAERIIEDLGTNHTPPETPLTAVESAKILNGLSRNMEIPSPLSLPSRLRMILALTSFAFINLGLGFRPSLGRFLDSTTVTRFISYAVKSFRSRGIGG